MYPDIQVDSRDVTPLWKQIEESIRRLISSGALLPGAPVPSVRDLARELRINPATVARAYQRLMEARLLIARRGEGTYVSVSPPVMEKSERLRLVRETAQRYAIAAASAGSTEKEMLTEAAAAWRRLGSAERGEKK
jgi:GntR family transcriptional regulator